MTDMYTVQIHSTVYIKRTILNFMTNVATLFAIQGVRWHSLSQILTIA